MWPHQARYRLSLGLTQAELAERAAISERAISDLERGVRRAPYPGTLRRLAAALRLSDSDLASLMAARTQTARERPVNKSASSLHKTKEPLTSLIGRTRELREVRALLENARLLTLTGAGGIGKTRLAEAVATGFSARFEDGLIFVALAAIRDPSVLLQAIASSLGVRDSGARPLLDVTVEYLKDSRMLLILDNFEQIADAAPLLPQLLAHAIGLSLLVTSRAVLRITGEHESSSVTAAVRRGQTGPLGLRRF